MIVVHAGTRYVERKFALEAEFEAEVARVHKTIFGEETIYIDTKKKIGATALGSSIPDAFLFDMSDRDNFEFYLVEVELESHDFYRHIFPQITKFFAFYRNSKRQKELVEKLFAMIDTDETLKRQFKKHLGDQEIFKFLSDLIDSSQNILLVIDGAKPELPEISDTYSDTWGKMVRVIEVRRFVGPSNISLLTVHPEFEIIEFSFEETPSESEKKDTQYSEEMHLEGTSEDVKKVYSRLKDEVSNARSEYVFNPQKYYISIKGAKNIVFLTIRKKKLRMVVMMPEEAIRAQIHHHPVKSLSESVQKFYNGPCATVDIMDLDGIEEVVDLIVGIMKETENGNSEGQHT